MKLISKLLLCCLGFAFLSLPSRVHSPIFHQVDFLFKPPSETGKNLKLWATWYWTPSYHSEKSGGVSLRDSSEKPLGVSLKEEDFCHAAVQGSVSIDGQIYNYDTQGKVALADCSKYRTDMPHAPYVRFKKSNSKYGEGENDFALVPYRSIAIDPKFMRIGTLLYIPEARGNPIRTPEGKFLFHDGYFFAADTGFGVYGNHIDVFNGVSKINPFEWVASTKTRTIQALVVTDKSLFSQFKSLHALNAE